MKKNFLRTLAVAAIAMFAGYNVYWSELKIEGMSELALKNVEALAIGESSQRFIAHIQGRGVLSNILMEPMKPFLIIGLIQGKI